jgi:sugar lactone lactonase YvrE
LEIISDVSAPTTRSFDRREISSSRPEMNSYRRIGDQIDILGESPIWHEREQALY